MGKSSIVGGAWDKKTNEMISPGMEQLNPKVKWFITQQNGNFNNYDDDLYHGIFMDEFIMTGTHAHFNLQVLNMILSGEKCMLWKMCSEVRKFKNLPVLLLSNFHPMKAIRYNADKGEMKAFASRLDTYRMLGHATVEWIPEVRITRMMQNKRETMVIPHDSDCLEDSHQQSQEESEEQRETPLPMKKSNKKHRRRQRKEKEDLEIEDLLRELTGEEDLSE